MGTNKWNLFNCAIVLLLVQRTLSLRDVYVRVPEAAQRGSKVEMKCFYQLEQNEVLYSVKWYRGDREFCRYSPRDVPPLKVFHIPGIEVNRAESDAERVTIDPVTKVANGRYTCEVSADAPSFQTHQVHTYMYVVELPESGPSMRGLSRRYKVGMKLKAECVSPDSYPAANISFFVNNEPAQSQHVWHRVEAGKMCPLGQMWTSYSTIQFTIQQHHFIDGRLKVRCTALIYSIYTKSLEKSLHEERVRTTPAAFIWNPNEAFVYPIHRVAENNTLDVPASASSTSRLLYVTTVLLLPTVLR